MDVFLSSIFLDFNLKRRDKIDGVQEVYYSKLSRGFIYSIYFNDNSMYFIRYSANIFYTNVL